MFFIRMQSAGNAPRRNRHDLRYDTPMLEVHPPHHSPTTWRDFLLHIVTIVIGLLIAIGLEQTVEYFHHRHIVHVARENIHHEIEINDKQASEDLGYLEAGKENMQDNIKTAHLLGTGTPPDKNIHLDFRFTWSAFNDTAWLSARDSGALTYMPIEEVQSYADLYEEQKIMNDMATTNFAKQEEGIVPLVVDGIDHLTPGDARTIMESSGLSYVRLGSMHDILQELKRDYDAALKR